jgi:biopolymer transport protein ExbD
MARRPLQEINAGSMADIAFLLLIFFLVTTTMDTDKGILRILPPPIEEDVDPPIIKERNVYVVLVNANDQLLVQGMPMRIEDLKDGAMKFLTNSGVFKDEYTDPKMPLKSWIRREKCIENINAAKAALAENPSNEKAKIALTKWENNLMTVDMVGEYKELPSSAMISLQNDNGTSYDMYIQVQNELQSAVNQLRDDLSMEKFGVTYDMLNPLKDEDKDKIIAVRQVFPQRISEAEPKDIGGN